MNMIGESTGRLGMMLGAVLLLATASAHAQSNAPATTAPPALANGQSSSSPAAVDQAPRSDTFDERVAAILGQPGGLTSDQVAREAIVTSFDVQARHQDAVAAAAALDEAFMNYFPRVSGVARYARLSDIPSANLGSLLVYTGTQPLGPAAPSGQNVASHDLRQVPLAFTFPSDDIRFGASLSIPLSDYLLRLSQTYNARQHNRRAADLNEEAARLRAGFQARIAYYNWVRARLAMVVTEQAVQQAREHLADTQHMFAAGSVSQADVLRVQSQLANAQLALTRATDLTAINEEIVRTATHVRPGTPLAIGEDVRGDVPTSETNEEFAHLLDEAVSRRPEVQALNETIGGFRELAQAARAGYYPRVDGFADVLTANPNPRYFPPQAVWNTTWEVGAQLTWAINDPLIAHTQVRQSEARVAQAVAQRGAAFDQLRSEVMQSFTVLRDAIAAVQTTATGLAAAEESYRVRRVLFHNGRATSVELTDAESDLTRSRLESLNAHIDLRIAREQLIHATGRDRGLAEQRH
jgi:outer membrane protein TolC